MGVLLSSRISWETTYFFDDYLKETTNTGVDKWPRVILEILEEFYNGAFRKEKEFPLEWTQI